MAHGQMKFSTLLDRAERQLEMAGFGSPKLDARLLLQYASGKSHAALIGSEFELCPKDTADKFRTLVKRRLKRESVHRILEQREFHSIPLWFNEGTLEPRDDTECLIDLILEHVEDKNAELHFCDLGTGSGAIGIALMHELPLIYGEMIDISTDALLSAHVNANASGLDSRRYAVFHGDWRKDLKHGVHSYRFRYDLIVSNPPYIPSKHIDELEPEVRDHDPRIALDGGEDGLDAYRTILKYAALSLKRKGFVAFEIGHDQLEAVREIGEGFGWVMTKSSKDLGGNDRAIIFERSPERPDLGFGLDKPLPASAKIK